MTDAPDRERFCSFAPVTDANLVRLRDKACVEKKKRCADNPSTAGLYKDRLRLICLCQGAALHRVAGERGVQDFDVWCFFEKLPHRNGFPGARFERSADFGPSEHGRNPDDPSRFVGRRIDVWFRAIDFSSSTSVVEALRRYLRDGRTDSAKYLAARPVIGLWPDSLLGEELWKLAETRPFKKAA